MPTPSPTTPRLLQSAVRSLGTPEQDVEAMTREQGKAVGSQGASGGRDAAPVPRHPMPHSPALPLCAARPRPERTPGRAGAAAAAGHGAGAAGWEVARPRCGRSHGDEPSHPPEPLGRALTPFPTLSLQVAMLVDRALERQDLSRDGLLDPAELLLLPRQSRPPGQPLQQQLGELLAGTIAVPRVDTEMPRGDAGVSGPGHGLEGGQAATQAEAPNAEGMELEDAPEPEGPDAEAVDAEEAPEIEALEGEAAPAWGDPGEG